MSNYTVVREVDLFIMFDGRRSIVVCCFIKDLNFGCLEGFFSTLVTLWGFFLFGIKSKMLGII